MEETVLVVPQNDRSAIAVIGKDARSWLNGLVTCDLAKRGPGDAAYGLLVEKKGRIQTDLFVVPARAGEGAARDLVLAVPSALRDALVPTLDHYLIMEDAELGAPELAFWLAHGPHAAALVAELAPTYAGVVDVLGTGGAVMAVALTEKAAFEARLADVTAKLGGAIADEASWEAIRVERGLPRFGVEVDATLYPQEASLEKRAVSFDKGCYLGQEVVYMLENRGHVKRKLVPLDVAGDALPERGAPVTTAEGDAVGDVRSAVRGPRDGKIAAIAMVKWAHCKPGTALRVGGREAQVAER